MPSAPPRETYWINGEHLAQTLVIAGKPAAIVHPALNRAELLATPQTAARTIAAPWSMSPYDLVEEHFGFSQVRIVPSGPDRDIRSQAAEQNANFRAFVKPEQEARRSLTDALAALENRARLNELTDKQRDAALQLELAVRDIDTSKGTWTDGARTKVLSAMTILSPAQPQTTDWHVWLECERAMTADHYYTRAQAQTLVRSPAESERDFSVFRERDQKAPRICDRDFD